MEEDLKVLNVEYLSNCLLDPTHISKFSLECQTILYKSFKWRCFQMEDNLKILKLEYLSNCFLDHNQILNLSLDYQTIFWNPSNEDDLHWKTT